MNVYYTLLDGEKKKKNFVQPFFTALQWRIMYSNGQFIDFQLTLKAFKSVS